ncbi:MAG: NAD(+) synthase [Bacilli bacterium]
MENGFIKVAAATSNVKLLDIESNYNYICNNIDEAILNNVNIITFQELNLTGYSLQDLFKQPEILDKALTYLIKIKNYSKSKDIVIIVSLPILFQSKTYITAGVIFNGKILGLIPKTFLPNYGEFYDGRYFSPSFNQNTTIKIDGKNIPFGPKLLFKCEELPELCIGVEICEDLWAPINIGTYHALNGATLIFNPSASNELIGKDEYRKNLVTSTSSRLICGYIYASAGNGESTTDVVYSGHNIIANDGKLLNSVNDFENHQIYSIIDVKELSFKRSKNTSFVFQNDTKYKTIYFSFARQISHDLNGIFTKYIFTSENYQKNIEIVKKTLNLQIHALSHRLEQIRTKSVVIGVSGGLDSSLALLVAVLTFKELSYDLKGIHAISMPCFATTNRTKNNAEVLAKELGVDYEEIDISQAFLLHLKDINHSKTTYDIAYENAQARERTQILMDKANIYKGIVIGTGDLSELALGWATFNGDHMSMYNINGGVPKTLVKKIIEITAELNYFANIKVQEVLNDILNTPISPELIPGNKEKIMQTTETILGPYEIHDFCLYYFLHSGYSPEKIFRIARTVFLNEYSEEIINKTISTFFDRFIKNQFKRSSMPDSVKIGSISLSPRGDLKMPSDLNIKDLSLEI